MSHRRHTAYDEARQIAEDELLRRQAGSLDPASYLDYVPAADVRAWARANGLRVCTRGRISTSVQLAYIDAHGGVA